MTGGQDVAGLMDVTFEPAPRPGWLRRLRPGRRSSGAGEAPRPQVPTGELPAPEVPPLTGRCSVYTTGIGGTGIVTANRIAGSTVCSNAGQGCAITTRLLVPRAKLDEAVDLVAGTRPTSPTATRATPR